MKSILAALLITTSIFGQNINAISEGPVYDREGRMVAYHYVDGTQESYAYDDAWRMIRFTNRAGGMTTFVYTKNGSMTTIMPDGTTRN
jgi:YD repeat-containing protein